MSLKSTDQQLHLNEIHGSNILLKKNKLIARRVEGFDNGVTFTHRPVMIRERIHFRITEISENWATGLRIGFTINKPSNMRKKVLYNSNFIFDSICGNWATDLPISRKCIVSFYVSKDGFVSYLINHGEKIMCLRDVDTSRMLWPIIDVHGKVVEIEMLESNSSLLQYNEMIFKKCSQEISFHQVHGSHISLSNNKTTAYKDSAGHFAYVFTSYPLNLNEKIIIRINKLLGNSKGTFEYGLTSNNPSKIPPVELPEKTCGLLEFPHYWVLYNDEENYKSGDILIFIITFEGKFMVLKNCITRTCLLQVDIRKPLWLFIKLSEVIAEISIKKLSAKDYYDEMTECIFKISKQQVEKFGSQWIPIGLACPAPVENSTAIKKCLICYEKPVNCVIYRCGHMCMCYECAQIILLDKELGNCPLCRTSILDIIKID